MKYQYFLLIWFLFLNQKEKSLFSNIVNVQNLKQSYSNNFLSLNFEDEDVIKNFLFVTSALSFENLSSHRRKKIFSFSPKTREDFIYLAYMENQRDVIDLSFLQRIVLSRIIFKVKNKSLTFIPDMDQSKMINPIIIEVNNV